MVRIDDATKGGLQKTTRDVFISWLGPGLSIIKRGKKTSHLGTVQTVLKVSSSNNYLFLLIITLLAFPC